MFELPRYTRSVPAQWNDLQTLSAELETDPAVPVEDQREALFAAAQNLPNETLEENRYYALGLLVCQVAKLRLATPDARSQTSQLFANELCEQSLRNHQYNREAHFRGVRVYDLGMRKLNYHLFDYDAPSIDELAPGVEVLADSLQFSAVYRHHQRNGHHDAAETMLDDWGVDSSIALGVVHHNFYAGAMRSFSMAFMTRYGLGPRHAGDPASTPILEIAAADDLRTLDARHIAFKGARLRLDEFNALQQSDTELDTLGRVRFRPDVIQPKPPARRTRKQKAVPHLNRLSCPALQVAGSIPAVLDIVTEGVILADAMARELYPDDLPAKLPPPTNPLHSY